VGYYGGKFMEGFLRRDNIFDLNRRKQKLKRKAGQIFK
jgi:hypothetical protein